MEYRETERHVQRGGYGRGCHLERQLPMVDMLVKAGHQEGKTHNFCHSAQAGIQDLAGGFLRQSGGLYVGELKSAERRIKRYKAVTIVMVFATAFQFALCLGDGAKEDGGADIWPFLRMLRWHSLVVAAY